MTTKPPNQDNQEPSRETTKSGNSALKNTVEVTNSTVDKHQGEVSSTHNQSEVTKKEQDSTSTSDLLQFIKSQEEKPIVITRTTSTPRCFPCSCPETVFYRIHQQIGTQSRYTEFKQGGMVWNTNELMHTAGEYVCGFLNSEGGTIFLGVADSGLIIGLKLTEWQLKDIRGEIEYAIELIEPVVNPGEYSINFARVMEENGGFSRSLYVIEVCVKPRKPAESYYAFNNVVYIRRDRTIQRIYLPKRTRNKLQQP